MNGMGEIFSYALASSLPLAVMYLIYKWILAGENQHGCNRVLLWCIYGLSLSLPALVPSFSSFYQWESPTAGAPAVELLAPSVEFGGVSGIPTAYKVMLAVYLAGVIAAAVATGFTVWRLFRVISRGERRRAGRYLVVLTDSDRIAPFSWCRFIVMNRRDYSESGDIILLHEMKHLEGRHWIDLLVAQLIVIFQWFNPAAWLMREELKTVHEYLADEAVLHSGADARQYQMLLIKKAVGARFPSLANSLNHSKLKKRITMMYKQKSSTRRRLLRAAALVPALAAAVALFQVPQVARAIGAVSEITLSADAVKADDMPLKAMPAPDRKVTIISENNETAGMAVSASQTTKVAVVADNKADKADEPVSVSAVMPEFPGGMQALMNYLSQNLRFPKNADCATGRVVVKFVVTKTGKVSDVSILKSVGPEVDAEALRVVSSLPDFIPGKNEEGKPVSVYYALPINFTTTGGDDTSDAATPAADVKVTYYVNGKQVTKEEMLSIASDAIASINIENGADSSKTVNLTLK